MTNIRHRTEIGFTLQPLKMETVNYRLVSYQHSPEAVNVTQGQGDVDEHNGIAD